MHTDGIKKILGLVRDRRLSAEEALERLKVLPYEDIGFATIDHHRHIRQGMPEVILADGKTKEQVTEITKKMLMNKGDILITRATEEVFKGIKAIDKRARYNRLGRTIVINVKRRGNGKGNILLVTAGTADIPFAEEARETALLFGSNVTSLYDVGVAGLHRILDRKEQILSARVIIVVAGMDGVLPSVIGGLVDKPVIAVPTSRGYGASFGGLAALLTMLNSCAAGVAVVNIDNGFGAASLAHKINMLGEGE
ncbi:MAG: nickel pincer cofactor biosynthesis protein LarB [Nitrospirae bacterium]|nr:nickel pincer cofactor biosynthesis protein LarB [Nitrospirota bacterium]